MAEEGRRAEAERKRIGSFPPIPAATEGTLDPTGDESVRCTTDGEVPTVDNPTSEDFVRLWVPVRVDRIAFVDEASRAVLKEWTAANTPTKSDFGSPDATNVSCN